jgi:DNA-binding LytR/AlgR family response regulator
MSKKKAKKNKQTRKTAKARKILSAVAAPKRPIGRPPKPKPTPPPTPDPAPETPPAPQPPAEEVALKLLETLLLRLVSPLKSLPVQTPEAVVYVRPEDIAYISTSKNPKDRHIYIVDREGREWLRFDVLKKLFERLSGDPRFFMAHKSNIINLYAVKTLFKNPATKLYEVTFGAKVKGTASVAGGNLKALRARLEL